MEKVCGCPDGIYCLKEGCIPCRAADAEWKFQDSAFDEYEDLLKAHEVAFGKRHR